MDTASVTVDVELPPTEEPPANDTPDTTTVVVVTPDDSGSDTATLVELATKLAALEATNATLTEDMRALTYRVDNLDDATTVDEDPEPDFEVIEVSEPLPVDEPPEETHWLHRPMREWFRK